MVALKINFELKSQVIEPGHDDGRLTNEQFTEIENTGMTEVKSLPQNLMQRVGGLDEEETKMGVGFGEQIYISEDMNKVDHQLLGHEFGHNLGITHKGNFLMNESLNGLTKVLPSNISDILGRAGIGPDKNLKGDTWLGG